MIIPDDRCPEYLVLDEKERQCMLPRGHKGIKHKYSVAIGDTLMASEGHKEDKGCCIVAVQWFVE